MPLSPNTQFGSYRIAQAIGSGGMGEVYRAHDPSLKRDVAIKVLPPTVANDSDRLLRFQREAELLASLNHPNVAHIYGLERGDTGTGIVMELVDGPTLVERIADGPLPVEEALRIATQIADALEAAHQRGIVHRDLKPANIKVGPDGTVKVLDFGIAKALDTRSTAGPGPAAITAPALTEAGFVLGTAAYMSPEQTRGKAVDQRTDVWAFGCVLYEMLAGRPAFSGEGATDTLARVLERDPDFGALPTLPAAVRRTLELCLQKNVRDRFADIRDVRLALSGAFAVPRPASPTFAASRRMSVAAAGLLILTGLSLGAAVWFATRRSPLAPETHLEIGTPPSTSPWSFAISPDGRRLVYLGTVDGRSSLWLRSLETGDVVALPGTDNAALPFWSGDGREVAFFKDGKLKVLETVSGATRDIADAVNGAGGSWGALGDVVLAPSGIGGIVRMPSAGGEVRTVTEPPASERHVFPSFLPNGRDFLFFAASPHENAIRVARDGNATGKRLFDADGPAVFARDQVFFIRQGKLFAVPFDANSLSATGQPVSIAGSLSKAGQNVIWVSASETGVVVYRTQSGTAGASRFSWFDRSGAELERIEGVASTSFALAPDEQHLMVTRNDDLWAVDLRRGGASRLTTEESYDGHPVFTPDGERVIYQRLSDRGDMFWQSARGGAEEALISDLRGKIPTDVSADGRLLLFKAIGGTAGQPAGSALGSWDLWAMPLSGDRAPFPILETPYNEVDGQFSPDGAWVLFQSDQSGQFEVYLQPFGHAGDRVMVSVGGGVQPRWRADGREIFYLTLDGTLMAVPVEPIKTEGSPPALGHPQPLFATSVRPLINTVMRQQYVPARDGQRFLINVAETETASPLEVIVNFDPTKRRE